MKIYFVDSFTNEKFKGNPAAVCLPDSELDDQTMQQIATEIGFSETAFVRPIDTAAYRIRFFTPKMEIPLCGHATLASAKILFDTASLEQVLFINGNGVELPVVKAGDTIRMQFPVYDTESIEVPPALLQALGLDAIINQRYSPRNKIILLEIESAQVLARLQPDFAALLTSYTGVNGVLVTAVSDTPAYDFQYRYFWPWAGTNEDPVTGGIQTFLTKYWSLRLNKKTFRAFQSSARTGSMSTELLEDRVYIFGEAVTILEGEWMV